MMALLESASRLIALWEPPDLTLAPALPEAAGACRLFKVLEITEEAPGACRLAMANVFSSLCAARAPIVYALVGRPEGVALHIGVCDPDHSAEVDLPEAANALQAAFEGNFPGSRLERLSNAQMESLTLGGHLGFLAGVPTLNARDEAAEGEEFQGVERLIHSLHGESWEMVVVAEPGEDAEIREILSGIYNLSTRVSRHVRASLQKSQNYNAQDSRTIGAGRSRTEGVSRGLSFGRSLTETLGWSQGRSESSSRKTWSSTESEGSSGSLARGENASQSSGTNRSVSNSVNASATRSLSYGEGLSQTEESVDKGMEELQKHLSETLIGRFQRGRSKGMFRTAIYVSAQERGTFDRLSRSLVSLYQGDQPNATPLRERLFKGKDAPRRLTDLLRLRRAEAENATVDLALIHSLPLADSESFLAATWLNAAELALVAGLPGREFPGLKIRKSVDFALNPGEAVENAPHLKLGEVVRQGRVLKRSPVDLPLADLNKHVFVTGVTGAGKTTTCMTLLLQSGLPFLVIEPAKTEYRALHAMAPEVEYYALGREDLTPFRLNPFEMLRGQRNLAGHVATLNAALAAVFPLEAAMPYMVEEAIISAYKARGWDLHSGENLLLDDPWAPESQAWPDFSDMIRALDAVIESKGLGQEFQEKYQGSLVARFTNLTLGVKGRMLNARRSLDFSRLLDRKVVIELEEIKDEQDKALFMGLLLRQLAECMKQRHRQDPGFRHLTLVEEAHRLLARPEPGEGGAKKMGVEMFANMLAEVRKYGEGLIIADQIPGKLIPDVIKNTNTKIVHRLFAADDRDAIGDSIGLSREQKDFLPLLQPGETIVFCGGWHGAVRVRIDQKARTDAPEIAEEEIRAQGRRQIWEQREALAPRLAKHEAMKADAEAFVDFLQEGARMAHLLLKVNAARRKGPHHLEEGRREKLAEAFRALMTRWAERLDLAPRRVGELVALLMLDGGMTREVVNEADVLALTPEAAARLCESLQAFDDWSRLDDEAKHLFDNSHRTPGAAYL